jgi:predicted transcriptional regulator
MSNDATLHLRLPAKLKGRLEALARSTKRSKSYLAVEAIAAYVDTNAWQVAEIKRGLAEADAGGPFIEHEAVVDWLESWGTDHERPPPKPRK